MARNRESAVLMYHAVPGRDQGPGTYDPTYAVPQSAFVDQLDAFTRARLRCLAVKNLLAEKSDGGASAVCLTFDDGHISNFSVAFPALLEHSATADFFVNPATVGSPGMVTWAHLRQMHERGMSIQSHGHSHRYFSDLASVDLKYELGHSRQVIEDKLGAPVTLLAPPGGRFNAQVLAAAAEIGYEAVCTSVPGYWNHDATRRTIPRLAVRDATSLHTISKWAATDRREIAGQVARYRVGYLAKRLLGNSRYDKLRGRLLSADQ